MNIVQLELVSCRFEITTYLGTNQFCRAHTPTKQRAPFGFEVLLYIPCEDDFKTGTFPQHLSGSQPSYLQVNMSVAVIPMAEELGWSASDRGLVSSAFFWGYSVTQILGGYVATKYIVFPESSLLNYLNIRNEVENDSAYLSSELSTHVTVSAQFDDIQFFDIIVPFHQLKSGQGSEFHALCKRVVEAILWKKCLKQPAQGEIELRWLRLLHILGLNVPFHQPQIWAWVPILGAL